MWGCRGGTLDHSGLSPPGTTELKSCLHLSDPWSGQKYRRTSLQAFYSNKTHYFFMNKIQCSLDKIVWNYCSPDKVHLWQDHTFTMQIACFYIPGLGRSPGEENDNPLQYSCLENPMDGGAWRATVHGVAKSWTQLSDWHFHFHLEIICKIP